MEAHGPAFRLVIAAIGPHHVMTSGVDRREARGGGAGSGLYWFSGGHPPVTADPLAVVTLVL